MATTKSIFRVIILTLKLTVVFVIAMGIIINEIEVREEHYAAHADLVAVGIDVGYPMTMPETNTDIYVEYDTDTGYSWSRAACVEDDMKSALWGAKRLATADLRVDDSGIWLGTDRYYEGSNDLWPVELRESRMRKGIPPTVRVYYVVEESNYRYYVFLAQKPCRAFHYSPGELSG